MTAREIKIGKGCQYMDVAAFRGQSKHPGYLKAELLLYQRKQIINHGVDVSFSSRDQILGHRVWCIGERSRFIKPHCSTEFRLCCFHLGPIDDALVASIAVNDFTPPCNRSVAGMRSCTLAAVINTEWIRPGSLSTTAWN